MSGRDDAQERRSLATVMDEGRSVSQLELRKEHVRAVAVGGARKTGALQLIWLEPWKLTEESEPGLDIRLLAPLANKQRSISGVVDRTTSEIVVELS